MKTVFKGSQKIMNFRVSSISESLRFQGILFKIAVASKFWPSKKHLIFLPLFEQKISQKCERIFLLMHLKKINYREKNAGMQGTCSGEC
jgi:hypothetical protein